MPYEGRCNRTGCYTRGECSAHIDGTLVCKECYAQFNQLLEAFAAANPKGVQKHRIAKFIKKFLESADYEIDLVTDIAGEVRSRYVTEYQED